MAVRWSEGAAQRIQKKISQKQRVGDNQIPQISEEVAKLAIKPPTAKKRDPTRGLAGPSAKVDQVR